MYDFSAPPAAICSLIIEDCKMLSVLPKGMVEMCLYQTRKRKDFEACAARSRLQLALHAHGCSSRCTLSVQQACCTSRDPLRDEIREVGPIWHPTHCPMGTVPRVLVRRTASLGQRTQILAG